MNRRGAEARRFAGYAANYLTIGSLPMPAPPKFLLMDSAGIPRTYAAEQGIAEEDALKRGTEEKSKEFVEKGAAVYTKA